MVQRSNISPTGFLQEDCPTEGPLHDRKIKTRAEFRKRMNICAANEERKRIQHFDQQFKKNSSNHFKLPSSIRQQQSCQPETNDSLDISPKFPGYLVFDLDT